MKIYETKENKNYALILAENEMDALEEYKINTELIAEFEEVSRDYTLSKYLNHERYRVIPGWENEYYEFRDSLDDGKRKILFISENFI